MSFRVSWDYKATIKKIQEFKDFIKSLYVGNISDKFLPTLFIFQARTYYYGVDIYQDSYIRNNTQLV
jgi:hypothetical protein